MPGRSIAVAVFAAVFIFAGAVAAGTAGAADLDWSFESKHPSQVSLAFYSQDRNHSWPGGDQVYVIDDWKRHRYSLSCNHGETICFGAWVRGDSDTYWGVGFDNEQDCDTCCYQCGYGETRNQILNE